MHVKSKMGLNSVFSRVFRNWGNLNSDESSFHPHLNGNRFIESQILPSRQYKVFRGPEIFITTVNDHTTMAVPIYIERGLPSFLPFLSTTSNPSIHDIHSSFRGDPSIEETRDDVSIHISFEMPHNSRSSRPERCMARFQAAEAKASSTWYVYWRPDSSKLRQQHFSPSAF